MGGTPSFILPNLWLGGQDVLDNPRFFYERGITHVLSLGPATPDPSIPLSGREHINVGDIPTADLRRHFRKAVTFIAAARHSGHTVYVHCAAGISRSTTCLCAYLMTHLDMSFERVLIFVASKRRSVCPNEGFVQQLRQFEASGERKALQHELQLQCSNYEEIRRFDLEEVRTAAHRDSLGSQHRALHKAARNRHQPQQLGLVEAQAQQRALRAVRQAMAGNDTAAGHRFGNGESRDDVGLGWLLGERQEVGARAAMCSAEQATAGRPGMLLDARFANDVHQAHSQKGAGVRAMSTPESSLGDRRAAGRPSLRRAGPQRPLLSTGSTTGGRHG